MSLNLKSIKVPLKIIFTVTNDTLTDQRMDRICSSLGKSGYDVTLIGRQLSTLASNKEHYQVLQLKCFFNRGFLFYAEVNLRLFIALMFLPFDAVCSIDLDTILPGRLVTTLKNKKIIFDSHEYYIETPELHGKILTKSIWKIIENISVRKINLAYSVNEDLSEILSKRYNTFFNTIRNLSFKQSKPDKEIQKSATFTLVYQGAVNIGRGVEIYIKAMDALPGCQLWIIGAGDILNDMMQLAEENIHQDRITFLGKKTPEDLKLITQEAHLGLNLLDPQSLNYYYSLANKYFDYLQAEIPSLNMDFPVYNQYLEKYDIGYEMNEYTIDSFICKIHEIVKDVDLYKNKCLAAGKVKDTLCWEQEEQKLISLYNELWKTN